MDAYEQRHQRTILFHELMKAGIPVHLRADDWYEEAETWRLAALQRLNLVAQIEDVESPVLSHEIGPIPQAVALQLCAEIYQDRRRRWYTWSSWRCWWCVKCGKAGIPARLVASPGYTGCDAVNRRYATSLG